MILKGLQKSILFFLAYSIIINYIFYKHILVNGTLNVYRNLGDQLVETVRDHIFVDNNYAIKKYQISSSCSSLQGVACSELQGVIDNPIFFNISSETEDKLEPSFQFSNGNHKTHLSLNQDLPITFNAAAIPKLDISNALSVFEESVGNDDQSPDFSSFIADGISWLIGHQKIFHDIPEKEKKKIDTDRLSQINQNTFGKSRHSDDAFKRTPISHKSDYELIQRLNDVATTYDPLGNRLWRNKHQTPTDLSNIVEQEDEEQDDDDEDNLINNSQEIIVWLDPLHWIQQLFDSIIRIGTSIISSIKEELLFHQSSSIIKNDQTDFEGESLSSRDASVESLSKWKHDKLTSQLDEKLTDKIKNSKHVLLPEQIWEKKTHHIHLNAVPNELGHVPEYFGSELHNQSNMIIRWVGDWVMSPSYSSGNIPLKQTVSASLDSFLNDKDSSDLLKETYRLHNISYCAQLNGVGHTILFSKPIVMSDIILYKKMFEKQHRLSMVQHLNESNLTQIKEHNGLNFKNNHHLIHSDYTESQLFVEGWYWDTQARHEFINSKSTLSFKDDVNEWFYTTLPLSMVKQKKYTRVWSVELSLDVSSKNRTNTALPRVTSLLNESDHSHQTTPVVIKRINVIDQIQSSPYFRIDGLTFIFSTGTSNEIIEDTNKDSHLFHSNKKQRSFNKRITPDTRFPLAGTEICLDYFTFNEALLVTNNITQDLKTSPVSVDHFITQSFRPGLILREVISDVDTTDSIDNLFKPSVVSPIFLLNNNKTKHIHHSLLDSKIINQRDRDSWKQYILYEDMYKRQYNQEHMKSNHLLQLQTIMSSYWNIKDTAILYLPEITEDGIVLHMDARQPMKRINIILQQNVPIESSLISLTQLQQTSRFILRKPSKLSSVFQDLILRRTRYPHPFGLTYHTTLHTLEQESLLNDNAMRSILLKRKLLEAARIAVNNAKRTHDMQDQIRRLSETASMTNDPQLNDQDDWETLSDVLQREISQSFKRVLQDHKHQNRPNEQQDTTSQPLESIDVIEIFEQDGQLMTKKLRVNLSSDSYKEKKMKHPNVLFKHEKPQHTTQDDAFQTETPSSFPTPIQTIETLMSPHYSTHDVTTQNNKVLTDKKQLTADVSKPLNNIKTTLKEDTLATPQDTTKNIQQKSVKKEINSIQLKNGETQTIQRFEETQTTVTQNTESTNEENDIHFKAVEEAMKYHRAIVEQHHHHHLDEL